MRRRYTEDDVAKKADEILDELYDAIDELGIEQAVNEDNLSEIAYEKAVNYYQSLEDDYADMRYEEERERRAGI